MPRRSAWATSPAPSGRPRRPRRISAIVALAALVASLTTLVATAPSALASDDYPDGSDAWCTTNFYQGAYHTPPVGLTNPPNSNCTSQPADSIVPPNNTTSGFYKRECTSFVAWRMIHNNGMSGFRNTMTRNGVTRTLSDAGNWAGAADDLGYVVDTNAAAGAVAWFSIGHVAWVQSVSGSNVTIEEYNFGNLHTYGSRTIAKTSVTKFIHFQDTPEATPGSPTGSFDLVQRRPGGFRIAGWATDPDTSAAINVSAYIDTVPGPGVSPAGSLNASVYRADVGNHAYDGVIPYSMPGTHDVDVYAVNDGAGESVKLENSKSITINHGAVGALDLVRQEAGTIRVGGWALDWDTADPVSVHIYVDGVLKGPLTAGATRSDIGTNYPGYGSDHAFNGTVPYSTAGTHNVCLWAINDGSAGDMGATQIECKNVTINNDPVGAYDLLGRGPGGLRLAGWGLDRSLDGAASIHVYVDGVLKGTLPANKPRPDIGAAYPGYGDNHAFDGVIPWTAAGSHQACAWVVGDGLGAGNQGLGCKTISVSNNPTGVYDGATGVSGGIRVTGWGIDPDTDNALSIHVYRDNAFAGAFLANTSRPDVVSATGPFPGFSTNHGFNSVVAASPGSHSICLYLIGVGPGAANQGLGCRTASAS